MNERKIEKKIEKKIQIIKRGGEEWKIKANRHVIMKIMSLYRVYINLHPSWFGFGLKININSFSGTAIN